uniref:Purple acid phosphatase N-terminal domain-containing protein n=1 Tax=Aegilops tauschii subsp. strangulata TaxID=200361 RepID=A0A453L831_AEGTS
MQMTVTWTSGYGISEAHPFVEWGMKGSHPVHAAADTVTFGRESLCGEPARSVGWRDPGFIHTAFLKNLSPEKEYYYKIGHRLRNGQVIWGKPKSFRAPPYPGQKSLQRVVIFGDMGKGREGRKQRVPELPACITQHHRRAHQGPRQHRHRVPHRRHLLRQRVSVAVGSVHAAGRAHHLPSALHDGKREPRARFPQQRVAVQRHGLRRRVRRAGRDHVLRSYGEERQLLVLHGLRDVPVLRGGQRARLAGGHGAVQLPGPLPGQRGPGEAAVAGLHRAPR